MEGWIKLHRKLLDSTLWICLTPEQKVIAMTLLLMVNHKPGEWYHENQLYNLKVGQCVTSYEKICEKANLFIKLKNGKKPKIQVVRTALKNLKNIGFLTHKSTHKNTIVTICNWDSYQNINSETNTETNTRLTPDKHQTNTRLTTNKNDKNENNVKNSPLTPQGDEHACEKDSSFSSIITAWKTKHPQARPLTGQQTEQVHIALTNHGEEWCVKAITDQPGSTPYACFTKQEIYDESPTGQADKKWQEYLNFRSKLNANAENHENGSQAVTGTPLVPKAGASGRSMEDRLRAFYDRPAPRGYTVPVSAQQQSVPVCPNH